MDEKINSENGLIKALTLTFAVQYVKMIFVRKNVKIVLKSGLAVPLSLFFTSTHLFQVYP
jgi:hypothetical protein